MMTEKLTKRLIDSFKYEGEDGARDVRWDSEISGFGVRIYPSAKKSFILSYRQKGTKRLFTIGQYGNITLEQARVLAQKKMGEVADGKDPLLNRKAAKKKHDWTVNRAGKDFIKKLKAGSDKHHTEVARIFKKDVFPVIGSKPIDEVTKDHILKILDAVMERGSGVMANRTLTRLSRFFNWCIERNLIEHSPTYKLSKPTKEQSRERTLADYEIKDIWLACEKTNYPFGPLVRFLFLTGQRRGEAASIKWEYLDEEKQLWNLPREDTKSDRSHSVHLTPVALKLIKEAPHLGDYVFSSTGDRPFENFSRAKKILDKKIKAMRPKDDKSKMASWTLHDIRRTVATGMARLEIAPHIVEKILNHTSGSIRGVAAIYNRHKYTDEMKAALEKWAGHIEKVLQTDYPGSYVSIPKKKKD